jgi:hypothetical protein
MSARTLELSGERPSIRFFTVLDWTFLLSATEGSMLPKIPLPGPSERPKRYLKKYGFERPRWKAYRGIALLGIITGVALLSGWFVHEKSRAAEDNGVEVSMAFLALGALVLGYQQWREAREEASMEMYYERLDIANRRRECAPSAIHKVVKNSIPELAREDPAVLMYVYVELDNLEYVAGKYRLGYMRAGQAFRGLRTFQRRCLAEDFRRIARIRARGGDYHKYTANIVTCVCEQMENELVRITADEDSVEPL